MLDNEGAGKGEGNFNLNRLLLGGAGAAWQVPIRLGTFPSLLGLSVKFLGNSE